VPLYFELDGTFPSPRANPWTRNLVDLQKAVVAEGADIGLAWAATPTAAPSSTAPVSQ
jgi:phosphomannomutase